MEPMVRIPEWALVLILPVSATAVETYAAQSGSALEEAIANCRAITTAIGRLDCYDSIELGEELPASKIVAAATTKTVIGTEDDLPSEEEKFGFEFDVKDALQSVTSDITAVRKNAKGGLVLTLANGQVWQQSDGQTLFLDDGDSVTITRGALSAFYLTKEGKGRRYKFARAE